MLGFGGHFLTKARRYSVTFTALRQARITYRRHQDTGPDYTPFSGKTKLTPNQRPSSSACPTPEPAGAPSETPSWPTPQPTKHANDVRSARRTRQ